MRIEKIVVERDAFAQCAEYLQSKNWTNVLLIADRHTQAAAGDELIRRLKKKQINSTVCLIDPDQNGDVKADEVSLIQALIAIDHNIDALLAVGAGTIHDIARFCSDKTRIPFVSIPTAPSVDGFTSVGAPLIIRGRKTTLKAVCPQALFADVGVLTAAPAEMIAAGFGDMLAKFTSLADWRFGHLTAGEPYSEEAAAITETALRKCVSHVEQIAAKEEEGIRVLMDALIESGQAMLLFGQSHPASGAEHHLSHFWEMDFIEKGRAQILHGAKVAAATVLIANVYKQYRSEIMKAGIVIDTPDPERIAGLLKQAGAPVSPEDLQIDEELVSASLQKAHTLRDRHTMLRYLNEQKAQLKKENLQ
ncbi:sn-glycerol-1-phosphate dehydrogenase [Domibacillus indicus]|uniref:sn-glycerol-1-phosphate dehydrogenase n=1 Tax=Domibacillus indicus TaxID=1437523 RepID=UPI000698C724|nr:sn-glycerol-1-phosphate dehydrogenase [Domibacillus indicus]